MKRFWFAAVLLGAAAGLPAPAPAALSAYPCEPTPIDGFGPFGRGRPPLRAKIGTGHVLAGTVIAADTCKPVAGAHVEFWQSNANGVYKLAGSATVVADRSGRFRFQGPAPARYESLPPHIHIRINVAGYKPLLTRYVVAAGERRGRVRLVLEPDQL
jgi:protocatechuate 3,4-dioxygenase beta subunit